MRRQNFRPLPLALAIAFVTGVTAVHAQPASPGAAPSATAVRIVIPAQPLAQALNEWARQTRSQLIVQQALVKDKAAPAVSGVLTPQHALGRLLAGSGLIALREGSAIVIKLAVVNESGATLAQVTVTDRLEQENASGPALGYVARRSATGTKVDLPLIETPQAVSVVTRAQAEDQAADSLEQVFSYTPGIYAQEANRYARTGFLTRGFYSGSPYLDGSRFALNSLSGSEEPYAYERFELLKGPGSILFGQAAPGGIINLVTKRPTSDPLREVELQIGNWGRRQVAADMGGPLSEDGKLRYRLTALARDSESMIRRIPDHRMMLNAAIDWKLSDATLLTMFASHGEGRTAYNYGKPYEGTLLPNPNGQISRRLFVGERGFDKHQTDGTKLRYQLEHRFNDTWKFRQHFLVYDHDVTSDYLTIARRLAPSSLDTTSRVAVSRLDKDRGFSLDNQLQAKVVHGRVQHTLLIGIDYGRNTFERDQRIGSAAPLNLFHPVYGSPVTFASRRTSKSEYTSLGLYAQDHIKLDERWIAMIGGRYDKPDGRDMSRVNGGTVTTSKLSSKSAFSPRVALMYLSGNGLAPYYSFTQSFETTPGFDFSNRPFDPTTGKQHELGMKYEPAGRHASITAALYELTQDNVLTNDPVHAGFSVQTGQVRSRGMEIEGRANLSRALEIVGGVSITDAKITKSNTGTAGRRPVAVPRNTASLWANYRLPKWPGWSVGLGVRRVGQQVSSDQSSVPTYTVYDAAVRYDVDHWHFALNVKNLSDKTYLHACSYACFYGDERNVTLTARYSW